MTSKFNASCAIEFRCDGAGDGIMNVTNEDIDKFYADLIELSR
jgi:hypothetical protein